MISHFKVDGYWDKAKAERGWGKPGIVLREGGERVLSITCNAGMVTITEEYAGFYSATLWKDEAIEALEEAISWIKEQHQ